MNVFFLLIISNERYPLGQWKLTCIFITKKRILTLFTDSSFKVLIGERMFSYQTKTIKIFSQISDLS